MEKNEDENTGTGLMEFFVCLSLGDETRGEKKPLKLHVHIAPGVPCCLRTLGSFITC